jgi:hypothetical protein
VVSAQYDSHSTLANQGINSVFAGHHLTDFYRAFCEHAVTIAQARQKCLSFDGGAGRKRPAARLALLSSIKGRLTILDLRTKTPCSRLTAALEPIGAVVPHSNRGIP